MKDYRSGERLVGMLGTPNGNIRDDWVTPDGVVVATSSDLLYKDAYNYCVSNWCVLEASSSLFQYEDDEAFDVLSACDKPFEASSIAIEDLASEEIKALCGSDQACLVEGTCGDLEDVRAYLRDRQLFSMVSRPGGEIPPTASPPLSGTDAPTACENTSQNEAISLSGWGTTDTNGSWDVSEDSSSVFQTVNGRPTFFCSDFMAFGNELGGTIEVETGGDDDYVGFAFGYNPNDENNPDADFLLLDWKQRDQNYYGLALAGLALSRVTGIPQRSDYWNHQSTGGNLLEIARGDTLGSTGWADNTSYDFRFVYTSTKLLVFIDNVLQMDISSTGFEGGPFPNGKFCFYNYSQARVRYAGLTRKALSCEPQIPTSSPGTSAPT